MAVRFLPRRAYNARDLPGAQDGGTISHGTDTSTVQGGIMGILESLMPAVFNPNAPAATASGADGALPGAGMVVDIFGNSEVGYYGIDMEGNVKLLVPGTGAGGGGVAGPSGAIIPFEPVMPPAIELLSEMRARRTSQRTGDIDRLTTLLDMVSGNLPENLVYYPGYEPGGAYDYAMRRMGGKPGAGEAALPLEQRKVQRKTVPIPAEIPEPTVGEEMSDAQRLAEGLMQIIQLIQTGQLVTF